MINLKTSTIRKLVKFAFDMHYSANCICHLKNLLGPSDFECVTCRAKELLEEVGKQAIPQMKRRSNA